MKLKRKSYAYSINLDDFVLDIDESIEFPEETYTLGDKKFLEIANSLQESKYFYLNSKGRREELVLSFKKEFGKSSEFFPLRGGNHFAIVYSEDIFEDWHNSEGELEIFPTGLKEDKSIIFFAKNDGELEKIDKIEDQKIKEVKELNLNGDGTLFGKAVMEDDKTYKFMFDGRKYRLYPLN